MNWQCSSDRVRGIDVSGWQKDVDWLTVAQDTEIAFVYVKGAEGTSRTKSCKIHMEGAEDAGLMTGLYFFGRPDSNTHLGLKDAVAEAKVASQIWRDTDDAFGVEIGPILDLERGRWHKQESRPAAAKRHAYNAEWALTWLQIAERETGRLPWIYTAKWAWNAYVRRAPKTFVRELGRFPLILADYDGNPEDEVPAPFPFWTVWQDSGSGTVAGVPGKVDTNWMRRSAYDALLKGTFDEEYREIVP